MEEKLVCPICSKEFKLLGRHLKLTHKLTKEEVKDKYPGLKLVTDSERERLCSSLDKYREKNWENPEYQKKMKDAAKRNMQVIRSNPELMEKSQKCALDSRMKKAKENPEWWHDVRSRAAYKCWEKSSRREAHSAVLKRLWMDPEYREKHSSYIGDTARKIWKDPELVRKYYSLHRRGSRVEYVSLNGDHYVFRSTWEKQLAESLDALGVPYSYESLSIPYEFEGNEHRYIPDFYLDSYKLLLEVKPSVFVDELVEAKFRGCSMQ